MITMKMLYRFSALALLAFSLSSCDIISGPKKDYTALQNQSERVVLLEEFTGHQCGSCPTGHAKSKELKGLYPDNLVSAAIHAGGFSRVGPNPFVDDYRTTMGTELDAYYHADQAGYPKGMVNRQEVSGSALLGVADWGTNVASELAKPATMVLDLSSTYTAATRTADITVDIEYLVAGSATDNLVVLVTEDSIISPQKDYSKTPDIIDSYVHMDMLRTVVSSGTWGDNLKGATIAQGENFHRTYSVILDPKLKPEHCHIVAYVFNNSTKSVYQAAETEVE